MAEGNGVIAIIPARGGSKRLPRKNVLPFVGKPLIAWTIEAAVASGVADTIVVTSDDDEILEIAKRYTGVESFRRARELATDTTPSIDVVLDVVDRKSESAAIKVVILLQPTSPLRTGEDIASAYQLFCTRTCGSVVSVCNVDHPPEWCGRISDEGYITGLPNSGGIRSQDLPQSVRLNGAVYISSVTNLKVTRSFITAQTFAYAMEKRRSVDIDDELDFRICEMLALHEREEKYCSASQGLDG